MNGFLSGVRKSCPVATPHGNFDQVSISRFPSPKAFATLISGGSGSELGAALKGVLLGRVTLVSLIACWAMSDGAEAAKKHAKSQVSKSQVSHQIAEAPLSPAVHNWSGFYIGLNAGMAWGQFDPVTSTVKDGAISGAVPLVNAAGQQNAGPFGFAGDTRGDAATKYRELVVIRQHRKVLANTIDDDTSATNHLGRSGQPSAPGH